MADVKTQAPTLDTMTRLTNGAIKFTFTNNVPTGLQKYLGMYVFGRRVGSGSWAQINSIGYPAISNRQYVQYTKPGGGAFIASEGYEFSLQAYGPAGLSDRSNTKSVNAVETAAPSFTSATRQNEKTAKLVFQPKPVGAATVAATYAYARILGTSRFAQVGRTAKSQSEISVGGLKGEHGYEFMLRSSGPAGLSDPSSTKDVGAWWKVPNGVSDFAYDRAPNGDVSLGWRLNPTAEAPYLRVQLYRAQGGLGQYTLLKSLPPTAYEYTDKTAKPELDYRYQIVPVSHAGPATSTPSVTVRAVVLTPNAAKTVTAVYTATNRITVTWVRSTVDGRPITGQRLMYRAAGTEDGWALAVTPNATATTAVYTAGPNKLLEFSVETTNAAGKTDSEPSTPMATIPATPATVEADWLDSAAGTVRVSWPVFATIGTGITIEFSTNGTAWFPATDPAAPLSVGDREWVQEGADPTVRHYYRLEVVNPDISGAPESAWVSSPVVEPLTLPLAPAVQTPTRIDATKPIVIGIIHNPVDGTLQTAATIRYRKQGSAWVSANVGTGTSVTIPAGTFINGNVVDVEAQTAGASGELGPWSETLVFTTRAAMVVNITGPAATVTSKTTNITWTAAGQTGASVSLWDGAELVVSGQVGTAKTFPVTGLEDQVVYTAKVTAVDAYQESPEAGRTFTVNLPKPGAPSLSVTVTGNMVEATVSATGAARIELRHSTNGVDGWTVVGEVVGASGTIMDPTPPLNRKHWLKARAYTAAGGWRESAVVDVTVASGAVVVNWGTDWAQSASLVADLSFDVKLSADVEFVQFDRGPGKHSPVAFGGTAYTDAVGVSGNIVDELGSPEAVWGVAARQLTVWYRDPEGRSFPASLGGSVSFGQSGEDVRTISFTATETDHG